jgi:hypothetical protein
MTYLAVLVTMKVSSTVQERFDIVHDDGHVLELARNILSWGDDIVVINNGPGLSSDF